MLSPHLALLRDRLIGSVNTDGSWGYRPQTVGCGEPTALACLALSALGARQTACTRGLAWLASLQQPDGGVRVFDGTAGTAGLLAGAPAAPAAGHTSPAELPCWPTALAVLAWQARSRVHLDAPYRGNGGSDPPEADYGQHVSSAVNWLLRNRGEPVPLEPSLFGHDTMLEGWSWVAGTHSWVEPTAYAILALRAVQQGDHPRVREGVRLLLDRALPAGGWNYGNTRVLGNTLRAFPATTGIVLAALAGEPKDERIGAAINYLGETLPKIRSPLTLGWGVIGLTAWEKRPADVQSWLARCAARLTRGESNALHDALLLLAATGWRPEPRAWARADPDGHRDAG